MLENLYADIGGKIKNWAKWVFIVESVSAIVSGIVLLSEEYDNEAMGLLVIVLGPFVAWVSSWLLYAFGQLVEDIHELRDMEKSKNKAKQETIIKDNVTEKNFDEQITKTLAALPKSAPKKKAKQEPRRTITVEGDCCELCGKETKTLYRCRISNSQGWANICEDCAKNY